MVCNLRSILLYGRIIPFWLFFFSSILMIGAAPNNDKCNGCITAKAYREKVIGPLLGEFCGGEGKRGRAEAEGFCEVAQKFDTFILKATKNHKKSKIEMAEVRNMEANLCWELTNLEGKMWNKIYGRGKEEEVGGYYLERCGELCAIENGGPKRTTNHKTQAEHLKSILKNKLEELRELFQKDNPGNLDIGERCYFCLKAVKMVEDRRPIVDVHRALPWMIANFHVQLMVHALENDQIRPLAHIWQIEMGEL